DERPRPAHRAPGLLRAGDLVRARDTRLVHEPLDRHATNDVGFQDLLEIGLLDAAVPDVFRVDHHHGAMPALREAPRLVDANLYLPARCQDAGPERLDVLLDITLGGAALPARAHEHVALILTHTVTSLRRRLGFEG